MLCINERFFPMIVYSRGPFPSSSATSKLTVEYHKYPKVQTQGKIVHFAAINISIEYSPFNEILDKRRC